MIAIDLNSIWDMPVENEAGGKLKMKPAARLPTGQMPMEDER